MYPSHNLNLQLKRCLFKMKFSVIGSSVDTSPSPLLHSWIYKELKLDHIYEYIKLSKNSVDNIVDEARKRKLNGANITMPFKESIISHIDTLDDVSKKIGAVNCIQISNDDIKGYNTDLYGFQKLIDINKISLNDKTILILGSGGVSRAISLLLKNLSLNFSIFNRSKKNLDKMLNDLSIKEKFFDPSDKILISRINMVINCLPPTVNYSIILRELLPDVNKFDTIIDVNYSPIRSNINTKYFIDGIDMFIFQAIKSNEIWMNKNISKAVDYSALKSFIQGKIKC